MSALRCPELQILAERMVELYREKASGLTGEELVEVESELELLHDVIAAHRLTCEVCSAVKKPANSERLRHYRHKRL